ncbi:MFS general substrate transporter [Daldinia loculata]|uniref:MFS general substrate transporter n=1 Tax=Daldinia loculata TaxID=103429 RepID=UPI0020C3D92F|nr:MFS general substrate transporter [Daldinia loculata]KAI1642301.1 MFS general substrate transporter [Daldinia loculata]
MSVTKASATETEYATPLPDHHQEEHDGNGSKDIAASFLAKNVAGQRISVTPAESARVLRRIDAVILPIMLTVYFLQGLDKTTLAYASVFGLIEDTGLVGDQYSWLGSIVYLAQLVMQPPLAWLLVRLPIAKFTSAMVLLWGISLTCMAAAHNFDSLLATRFFLGVFEASVAPSFVAITQMWWRRREQTCIATSKTTPEDVQDGIKYVNIVPYSAMNGFTNMFGSLITYGLGHISSQLRSYQIIFLFFGIITVAYSFIMLAFMPDSPVEAKFLSDEDKLIAVERLRMNQMGVVSREWRNDHLKEALLDPKSWLWFALLFSISIPSGGISTFGPLIIKTFGFDPFGTILFNIPFGFVQLVATVGGALVAQKIKMKGPVIAALCLPPIAGCVMLMVLPRDVSHRAPLLAGYYLISVYPGITPLIYSWASQNTAGDTKKKCTNAILFIGQSVGNVVGPMLYSQTEAPGYTKGLRSNLALYIVLNAGHAKRRVAMGKSAVIVDTSLDSAEVAAAQQTRDDVDKNAKNAEEGDVAVASNEGVERPGERAFENLTDLQNEEFVFVF